MAYKAQATQVLQEVCAEQVGTVEYEHFALQTGWQLNVPRSESWNVWLTGMVQLCPGCNAGQLMFWPQAVKVQAENGQVPLFTTVQV